MKMGEIAKRINAHLDRFERDPNINKINKYNLTPYYFASASYYGGPRIHVRYISFQQGHSLTKNEALRYLEKLDSGFVGRHFEALEK